MTIREPWRGPDPSIEECRQWIAVVGSVLLVAVLIGVLILVS